MEKTGELILKLGELILFILVSVVFLPMVAIVHYGTEMYEEWVSKILKF